MSALSKLTAPQLKEILKTHKKHHDIKYSKMKKAELVAAMDPIFEIKDGQVHKRAGGTSGPRETPGKKTKADRPSPSESASDFPDGHTKQGNDGRQYEVKANKNGVKRWVVVKGSVKPKPDALQKGQVVSSDRFAGADDDIHPLVLGEDPTSFNERGKCTQEKAEIKRLRKQLQECRKKMAPKAPQPKPPTKAPKSPQRPKPLSKLSPVDEDEEVDSGDDILAFNRLVGEIEDLIDDFKARPSMGASKKIENKLESLKDPKDLRDALMYLAKNVVKGIVSYDKLPLWELQDAILDKLESDYLKKKKIDKPLSKIKSATKSAKSPVSKGYLLKQMDKIQDERRQKLKKKAKACIDDYKEKLKKDVTLGKKLGEGANGAVYTLCEGTNCGKYVVKESILTYNDPEEGRIQTLQFNNEVKCLTGLQGFKAEYKGSKWVCISKLYGSGMCVKNGKKIGYIVMEASKPVPKNLSDQQRCKLLKELDAAFFSLLKAGWVHLDSHHENYLLNDEGLPMIIDWGYGWNANWGQLNDIDNYVANQHPQTDGWYFSDIASAQWGNLKWLRSAIRYYCKSREYATAEKYIKAIQDLGKKAYGDKIIWAAEPEYEPKI